MDLVRPTSRSGAGIEALHAINEALPIFFIFGAKVALCPRTSQVSIRRVLTQNLTHTYARARAHTHAHSHTRSHTHTSTHLRSPPPQDIPDPVDKHGHTFSNADVPLLVIDASSFQPCDPGYQRNNKRSGQKNLRCFPSCNPKGHNSHQYCGRPVICALSGKVVPPGCLMYAQFVDHADGKEEGI